MLWQSCATYSSGSPKALHSSSNVVGEGICAGGGGGGGGGWKGEGVCVVGEGICAGGGGGMEGEGVCVVGEGICAGGGWKGRVCV